MKEIKNVCLYMRVSTEDQKQRGNRKNKGVRPTLFTISKGGGP